MQPVSFHFNRRARGYLYRAMGGLALAVWLLIGTAEICPPFHAWLHGGSIPDDDDCVVVAIALGHVDTGTCDLPPVLPVHGIEIAPRIEIFPLVVIDKNLPPGRAPPVGCTVS
ncbi:MAG TPA: hypothetical protein VGI03_05645 [Verrucomicrobiae bacterium]|jgi:hypothetical protein